MWKKLIVLCISLIGTFSVAYAYYNVEMKANKSTFLVGEQLNGRMIQYPSNLNVPSNGFQKGDKIYIGTTNPKDSTPLAWQLIHFMSSYEYYRVDSSTTPASIVKDLPISGWLSASTESIAHGSSFTNWPAGIVYPEITLASYFSDMDKLNATLSGNPFIGYRNLTIPKLNGVSDSCLETRMGKNWRDQNGKLAFIPSLYGITSVVGLGTDYNIPSKDITYHSNYHLAEFQNHANIPEVAFAINGVTGTHWNPHYTVENDVRPFTTIDNEQLNKVVFGMSMGNTSSYAKVNDAGLSPSYMSIYEDTKNLYPMKLRVENQSLTITFTGIQNSNGLIINKIVENQTVNLTVIANDGSDTKGNPYTVSALIFDSSGKLIRYQPLGIASKTNTNYSFDSTDLALGKYKIALVNEAYSNTDTSPADCSRITNSIDLEIIDGHSITYTRQPQTGTTIGDYEYSKNVNAGQVIGKIDVNPQGVMPLTYTLESNGDNSYLNFIIDGLDATNSSSTNSLNIKIKNDAPDLVDGSLKAGNYKFCITSTDANGYPDMQNDDTKVCTSLTVEKTSTSIDFTDKTTTKKSITEAGTNWSETATATPTTGTKITYSVSGGDVGLINIDPDTGEITYKGNGSFGSVKIKATVDDDPSTGNDNYEVSSDEKEIIIYKEVGGYVQPHTNSSSITEPTFTAADANIKSGGTIGTIIGEGGTPDTIGGSTTTYTYDIDATSTHANFFKVDKTTGEIKTTANLSTGTYNIVVTVSDKWSTKNIPVTINVGMAAAEELKFYENKTSSKVITKKSVSFTDQDVEVYATVKDSSVTNKVKYSIEDNSTNVITVNENTGAVEIKGVGKVTIVAKKAGASGQAEAVAKLEFEVTAGSFVFKYVDDAGQELAKTGDKYNAYTETFAKDKKFHVYTGGNPTGTTVTYELEDKTDAMADVISVDSTTGEVTIINASKANQMGKIVIIATAHDPSGTYSDQSIKLPITIEKGTRVVSFKEDPIYVVSGKSSITPEIEVDGVPETEGKALISIDDSETDGTAWTDDNKTIKYEYSSEEPKDIKINVTLPADRNYRIAEGKGTLHIMGANDNVLAITTPGKIFYGENFPIKSSQDDSGSTNVQYTFEVDSTTYISNPVVTDNKAEFDAIKVSGTNTVTVTVTRTADGEVPLTKKVNIKVLPKPIEITIDHKEKLKGEANPELTYQDFSLQLVSWNGIQDVIQSGNIKLSTTAKESSNTGDYQIKGDSATLNKAYPNYSFTFKENTLTITEENIEDDWYHLELDDGNNTTYTGTWTNQNVNIISDHSDYVNVSKDQNTWTPNKVTVSTEGKIEQSFWMKKDSGAITSEKKETILIDKTAPTMKSITATDINNKLQDIINKLSGGIFFKPGTAFEITTSDVKDDLEVSGTASIDYKIYKQEEDKSYGSPIKQDTLTVTNEKAKITIGDSEGGLKSTTGTYKICVLPKDKAGNITEEEICKEITLKKINVDIDGDENPDFNDPDGDGCPDLNIKWKDPTDEKKWILINGDRDYDGIPDLNIDSDGDGVADLNVDTDHDGKPDLNLVILEKTDWKPTECVIKDESKGIMEEYCTGTSVKPQINVDTGTDNIPDINIDNKGDFKPHLNISSDGKTPAVNLVKLHEWKPNNDYASNKFFYDSIGTGKDDPKPELNIDTDNDGRPDLNLDFNGDGTPELNIDGDGDGIPDVNIDVTGNGKPDYNIDVSGNGYAEENIIKLKEWKPEKNVDTPFAYDTMEIAKKDQVEDGGVIVVDPGGNFLPNHAIKVDNITDQLDEETKKEIANQAGEQEIKAVYDVKFLEDNIETQPNGNVKVKVPVDTSIKNPKFIVEQKDGSYKIIEGTYEDGYLTYETNYVGKVSVIGDQENQGKDEPKDDPEEPKPSPKPTDPEPKPAEPKPTVQGTYTTGSNMLGNNMGGVSTGDTSNYILYLMIGLISLAILCLSQLHRKRQ